MKDYLTKLAILILSGWRVTNSYQTKAPYRRMRSVDLVKGNRMAVLFEFQDGKTVFGFQYV